MAERELAIVIRAKDLASKAIAGVNKQLSTVGKHAQRGMQNAAQNIGRGIQIAGAAAIGGLAYSVKVAGDFEAQMRTINTVAQETGDAFSGNLGKIGDAVRKMARDTGTPLEDLTAAYYDLVSAGISASDAQGVLEASNKLAIGGLATTAETVDLLTTAINSYGGDASKAALYADQFAVAIERGKVTAAEIAAGFAQVGPLASVMGVGIDEISAVLAQMTAKGVPASEVFTQMRAAMIALQRQTPDLKKVLGELGITNVEAEVASRGLVPVWNDLATKAEELGIPLIKLTGRVEGTMFALGNAGDEFESFNGHLAAVRSGTGAAQRQMEERQQGLNFQLARMRAILTDVGITLGSKLIPKIVPMLQKLAEGIEKNQDKIEKFADDVAAGFEKAVQWAMSLDWNAIGNSLKMAADFSRGLVEAFLSMPDWVKQAVITGWGLNKLTGGALGSITGALASGLIKGVLGMNAGVVNAKAGIVNVVGGPGMGGPAGGIGGAAGGLRGAINGGGLIGGLATGVAVAAPALAGVAAFKSIELEQGIKDMNADLGTKLDALPRSNAVELGASIASVEAAIDVANRDFITTSLSNATGLNQRLDAELTELQAAKAAIVTAQDRAATSGAAGFIGLSQKTMDVANAQRSEGEMSRQVMNSRMIELAGTQRSEGAMARAATSRVQAEVAAKGAAQAALQSEALSAVRATQGPLQTIAGKNFSPTVNVNVPISNFISINEWQRTVQSAQRTYSTNSGGI